MAGVYCQTKWEQVCRSKIWGGPGVANLKLFKKALNKCCRNLLQRGAASWKNMILFKYCRTRIPNSNGHSLRAIASPFWHGVLKLEEEF